MLVNKDGKVESDETFTVLLGALSNLGAGVAASNITVQSTGGDGVISNDDTATLTINDVVLNEGTEAGTTSFTFTVTLSAAVQGGFNVAYTTNNGTATTADGDYVDNDGSLTFAGTAGETKTITVLVNKDAKVEADETFTVLLGALSNLGAGVAASNITVQSTGGDGVISNDDTATLTINDVVLNEGTGAGTTSFTFTVTLSAAVQAGFNVAYTTNNGTATTADGDYVDNDGSLTFAGTAAETKTITVLVNKDAKVEADETSTVLLGALSNLGAGVAASNITVQSTGGDGVISNDDTATLTIDDVTLNEGTGAGTTSFTFTVTLSGRVVVPVSVRVDTADDTATVANNDYMSVTAGNVPWTPTGPLTQTVTVNVIGDTRVEPNETFRVLLSNLQAAGRGLSFGDPEGLGTILNDDEYVSISGLKFNDANGNTVKDAAEVGLSGWTIFLDTNNNGLRDVGEPIATTGANGNYTFTNLDPGLYRVREEVQTKNGWLQTTANPAPIVASSGVNVTGVNFGNRQPPTGVSPVWRPMGPEPIKNGQVPGGGPVSGRIAGLAGHPTDPNIIYLAAAGGGVWKTTNGGVSWTPKTDDKETLVMGAIALAPSDPNTIYAGTGEAHFAGDGYYGRGVLKSTNGGDNWELLGRENFDRRTISKIVVQPGRVNNLDTVYVAVAGSGNLGLPGNTGIWKSTDGGPAGPTRRPESQRNSRPRDGTPMWPSIPSTRKFCTPHSGKAASGRRKTADRPGAG